MDECGPQVGIYTCEDLAAVGGNVMVLCKWGQILVALGVLLVMGVTPCRAQTTPAEPSPAPLPSPGPSANSNQGPVLLPPTAASPVVFPDSLIPPGEPFFDPRFNPPSGWFTNLEMGIVGLHINSSLSNQVTLGNKTDTIQLPMAHLDTTVTPRIGVGYRFPVAGEITLTYQSIVSDGHGTLPGFDPTGATGFLTSRMNFNVVDLDYSGSEISLGHLWDMKWRAGLRYANAFFDSQAAGGILQQRSSNLFNGAGPRAGLDLWRALPMPGMALFGRIEGNFLVGQLVQKFEESVRQPNGSVLSGTATPNLNTYSNTTTPLILTLEGGLGYTPPNWGRWVRLSAVYQFQQWWDLGLTLGPAAQMTVYGVFFRAEVHY